MTQSVLTCLRQRAIPDGMTSSDKGQAGIDSNGPIAPFTLTASEEFPVPILLAAPHGGRAYPDALCDNLRDPDCLIRLEDRFADELARQVAELTGAALLVAHTPRAIIDLNRAPDDVDWSMIAGAKPRRNLHSLANRRARSGLGLVPRRLPGLGEIWKKPLERSELDWRIETVHRPYHATLGRTLEMLRDRWGVAVLLDLHSMPPLPRRLYGGAQPEFVIGDRFGTSCDGALSARALNYFAASGRAATHNRPYSGGYVLDRHGAPRRAIHALQLEVCRSTYLDARLDQPSARLPGMARLIAGLVNALASEAVGLGDAGAFRQAAE